MSDTPVERFEQHLQMMADEPNTQATNFHVCQPDDSDHLTIFLIRDQEVIEAFTEALNRITDNDPTGRRREL